MPPSPKERRLQAVQAQWRVGQGQVCAGRASACVPRKQEELVQQVRKRLEEALMADMLAHVEELARDEAPLDKTCGDEDDEEDEEDEEEEPEPDPELERV